MLAFFRSMIQSRFGAIIGVVFLLLIALAFAGADVTGLRTGNLLGGDAVATIGHAGLSGSELDRTIRSAYDNERQQNPTLTLKQFLAEGAFDEVLRGLIDRAAVEEWGKAYGIGASSRLVDSEIAKLPAFQGPDGKFSQAAYDQLLAQRGLSDKIVRDDLTKGLLARQLLSPAELGGTMPREATMRFAALLKEKRTGSILFIPSDPFAPKVPASDQQLAAFYQGNTARYQRPEHRTIRYALLDDKSLKAVVAPSEAEIQQRYKANAALYAASELRSITQVIVPTEAAAKALAAEVAGGKAIEAAAAAKGLSASKVADKARDALAAQTSKAVADAVFATAKGKFITPAKGSLGWTVARVDAVTTKPGKSLEQARAEIVTALTADKRKAALVDISTRAEEQFENGTSLADVAKTLGLTLVTAEPVLADGTLYAKPGTAAPTDVTPLIQAAFGMDREGQAQVAPLEQGARFALFDVAQIAPAAAPPLAEVKTQVARDYALQQGSAAAKAAADKVLAAVARKQPLADAAKALGVTLPKVDDVTLTREQVNAMQPKIPAPIALMFTMVKGGAKRLEAPNGAGWVVVQLKDVVPGQIAPNDPVISAASGEFGRLVGKEYAEELRAAFRAEVGVKRNEGNIRTLRGTLGGGQ
ncbi:peptidylprolyl isomerase [Novosphingobium sp. FKTRR1]|uniref:peptidylprolyl isomerase n=1 Tax=Novosphingobium sp. FKTRR1 TaxID=2879118 RepID=UPI001CF074A6|nr:peptidylprolyl isomerase [Novosphingobium sp. FKTRR1]